MLSILELLRYFVNVLSREAAKAFATSVASCLLPVENSFDIVLLLLGVVSGIDAVFDTVLGFLRTRFPLDLSPHNFLNSGRMVA